MLQSIVPFVLIILISCATKPNPVSATTIEKTVDFPINTSQLWNLLTDPDMTKQYMYGSEVKSNWEEGSPLLWQMKNEDDSYITIVKGSILSIEVKQELTYTMFVPSSDMEDIPANYLTTQYLLRSTASGSQLIIIQTGFDEAADGMKRYEDSLKGWDVVIPLMKDVSSALK